MPPIRVKVYGIFGMTRRTYLIIQALTLVVGLGALAVALWWPRPPHRALPLTARQRFFVQMLDLLPWLVVLLLATGAIETWIVLRRFARKQAEADRLAPPAS